MAAMVMNNTGPGCCSPHLDGSTGKVGGAAVGKGSVGGVAAGGATDGMATGIDRTATGGVVGIADVGGAADGMAAGIDRTATGGVVGIADVGGAGDRTATSGMAGGSANNIEVVEWASTTSLVETISSVDAVTDSGWVALHRTSPTDPKAAIAAMQTTAPRFVLLRQRLVVSDTARIPSGSTAPTRCRCGGAEGWVRARYSLDERPVGSSASMLPSGNAR